MSRASRPTATAPCAAVSAGHVPGAGACPATSRRRTTTRGNGGLRPGLRAERRLRTAARLRAGTRSRTAARLWTAIWVRTAVRLRLGTGVRAGHRPAARLRFGVRRARDGTGGGQMVRYGQRPAGDPGFGWSVPGGLWLRPADRTGPVQPRRRPVRSVRSARPRKIRLVPDRPVPDRPGPHRPAPVRGARLAPAPGARSVRGRRPRPGRVRTASSATARAARRRTAAYGDEEPTRSGWPDRVSSRATPTRPLRRTAWLRRSAWLRRTAWLRIRGPVASRGRTSASRTSAARITASRIQPAGYGQQGYGQPSDPAASRQAASASHRLPGLPDRGVPATGRRTL